LQSKLNIGNASRFYFAATNAPILMWIPLFLRIFSITVQWNPDFLNLQGKQNLVQKIRQFKKSGLKLQCSTEEREMIFGSSYQEFEKMRV